MSDQWANTKSSLAKQWIHGLGHEPFEILEIALLDAAGSQLPDGVLRLGVGSVDRVVIYPRQVMRAAVLADAAGVVMCHNHPSGDCQPTQRDRDATRMVYLAGVTLDVQLVDHVIVSKNGALSFREKGLL